MNNTDFMTALQDPNVYSENLRVRLLQASVEDQRQLIKDLPSIMIPLIDKGDRDTFLKCLTVFIESSRYGTPYLISKGICSPRVHYSRLGLNSHDLDQYWKEHAISVLLHEDITRCYPRAKPVVNDIFDNSRASTGKTMTENEAVLNYLVGGNPYHDDGFNPVTSEADYTLLYGAFEQIIAHMLNDTHIKIEKIKKNSGSYPSLLLTAVIQRYPALFEKVIKRCISLDTGYARGTDALKSLGSIRMERFGLKPAEDIIAEVRSLQKPIDLFLYCSWQLDPLTACVLEMACDPSLTDRLGTIMYEIFSHSAFDFDQGSNCISVAESLGMLDEIKCAVLSAEVRLRNEESSADENNLALEANKLEETILSYFEKFKREKVHYPMIYSRSNNIVWKASPDAAAMFPSEPQPNAQRSNGFSYPGHSMFQSTLLYSQQPPLPQQVKMLSGSPLARGVEKSLIFDSQTLPFPLIPKTTASQETMSNKLNKLIEFYRTMLDSDNSGFNPVKNKLSLAFLIKFQERYLHLQNIQKETSDPDIVLLSQEAASFALSSTIADFDLTLSEHENIAAYFKGNIERLLKEYGVEISHVAAQAAGHEAKTSQAISPR